jgi:hypothetical protein
MEFDRPLALSREQVVAADTTDTSLKALTKVARAFQIMLQFAVVSAVSVRVSVISGPRRERKFLEKPLPLGDEPLSL